MHCSTLLRRPGRARRRPHAALAGLLAVVLGAGPGARPAAAQSLDDAMLAAPRQLLTTVEYAHESWDEYWEGRLRRRNENIGTLSTRSVVLSAAYGVTGRVTLVASLPHVRTRASQGVLHGMEGWQDVTVAAKVRVLQSPVGRRATLSATALAGVGLPTTDYTPDFLPMSIGLGARRALVRGAVQLRDRSGLFADASLGHSWRSTVRLDRPAYYTDGQLVLSDEVAMPDVVEFAVGAGWQRGRLAIPVALAGQRTLGGGDIRRQDMPFVSNRMDFTRLHARASYALPAPFGLALHVGGSRTLSGRNVGRSTVISGGVTAAVRP